jgi:hypothetical protein
MEKTMTSNLGRMGVSDARATDPIDAPRPDSLELNDAADRAELRRALLVYGMAGALSAEQSRSAAGDVHA